MTHARRKAGGEGRDHGGGWSHDHTVGGAWSARSVQEGKTAKDMGKKVKTWALEHMKTWTKPQNKSVHLPKHPVKTNKTKRDVTKREKCERKRKLYPLRGRGGVSDTALSCHVLLTRLDNQEEEEEESSRGAAHKKRPKSHKKAEENTELKTLDKPSAREPRKRRLASLNAEAVNSLLLEKTDGPPGAKHAKKQGDSASTAEQTNSRRASKSEPCQSPKQTEKARTDDSGVNLYAPAPRRLAGLNAAVLLKLTSSSSALKQRTRADSKTDCAPGNHDKPKVLKAKKLRRTPPDPESSCEVCKSRSFESRLMLEGSPENRRLAKPGYQSHSILGYPMKVVKEEQVEAELRPYYCCPPEGSVEYCHRLALFLGQSEEHPVTSVTHECLVPPHPTLTLSAHPCLCAEPCYYVHIAHPGPTASSLSAQPLPCTHSPFCPRGVSGSKLLASSGIPHPAFCCHREACRLGTYAFQPLTSRTCSFSNSCSSCSRPIKTEGFSSSPDGHSHALLVPPALPLSGCPSMPRVKPSSPAPRLLSTLSDRRQAEVRLKEAKECPQNSKPSNGSLTMGHSRSSAQQKRPASAKPQKRASRRQATNGWRPVGAPTEKEVFIAGDDETVLRQCYEGVERDGELIRVRDTVLLKSGPRKKSLPYVAKISALWEDPRTGELMMSLFWYYRPEHTQGGRDPSMHCENEIFASRHQDENSVACIEERCYVLPLAQYCRFCALVRRGSEGVCERGPLVPCSSDGAVPSHRLVPDGVNPQLVYLCRHVYDFRYGRILKNLQ